MLVAVLSNARPKWPPEATVEFARQVTRHFFEVMPAESVVRRAEELQQACAVAAEYMAEDLLTPSMLPYEIARFQWWLELWARRGEMTPAERTGVMTQLRGLLEWGTAEICRARRQTDKQELAAAVEPLLLEAEKACANPLLEFCKRTLTETEVNQVKARFLARLVPSAESREHETPPTAVALLRRLSTDVGLMTSVRPAPKVTRLSQRVSVELGERRAQERVRQRGEFAGLLVRRAAEQAEPFEWLGCWAAQLLGAAAGNDEVWLFTTW